MITQNSVSYDQHDLQMLLIKFFFEKETEFGSAKLSTPLQSYNTEWDKIKDELIIEYDSLWQELANS